MDSNSFLNLLVILAIIWVVVLIVALVSLQRRTDIIKPIKIMWATLIFVAPFVGLLFYIFFSKKTRI